MSNHFVAECLDLASEQGWRYERSKEGWKLLPPAGRCQPGYGMVFITARCDRPRQIDEIRTRLRRAGLKFPDKHRRDPPMTQPRNGSDATPHVLMEPCNPYRSIDRKIDQMVQLLGEIQVEVKTIETKNSKLSNLRELLKEI